jgi:hypothetical protein
MGLIVLAWHRDWESNPDPTEYCSMHGDAKEAALSVILERCQLLCDHDASASWATPT